MPDWQQCGGGWRVAENHYLKNRNDWQAGRSDLQGQTATALAATAGPGAAQACSSRAPNSTSSGAVACERLWQQQQQRQPDEQVQVTAAGAVPAVRRAFLHTGWLSLMLAGMRLRMFLLCWPTQQCLRTSSMAGRLPVWRTHCDSRAAVCR